MFCTRLRCLLLAFLLCALPACLVGCGALQFPTVALDDNAVAEDACLDLWSLVHIGSGYALGYDLDDESPLLPLGLLIAYEGAEPWFWPGWNESQVNQNCDIAVGTLGYLVQQLSQR